jgi:putative DNA primase/helicase
VPPCLGGRRTSSTGAMVHCPCHNDHSPSLSIAEVNDRQLYCCMAGCAQETVLASLRDLGLWPGDGQQHHQPQHHPEPRRRPPDGRDAAARTELALRTWSETRAASCTQAEIYLRARAITVAIPPTLRFHPALFHKDHNGVVTHHPAMVAAVQNIDGRIVAIHRTYLKSGGSGKAEVNLQKMALGPIRGAAVRLAPAAPILCLTEGLETALSIQQATGMASWAALGTANLARVELPELVREIVIAADGDQPGERAAQAAAQRLLAQGRKIRIMRPPSGQDFNDVLRGTAA